ncbi:lamin tail domain-containing protein [Agrococcus sp. Ld7]|uniref:lamin tail domain-containing protein n=1 Tax=Agrococcus sp. Ld7 TaxID=649148 RepID=UPI00386CFCAE
MRRRTTALLAAAVPAALAASLLTAPAALAADSDIVINEVQSNSATDAPDFFELTNIGSEAVDISGWIARDDKDDEEHIVFPTGTVIAPGDFAAFEPDTLAGFGLGKQDSVRIFDAAGTLIAEHSWSAHLVSDGRVPDGTGAFGPTEPTPGAANIAREVVEPQPYDSPVVVNEVQSDDQQSPDGPDWVELFNTSPTESVDISDWILRDDDDLSEVRIPTGTELAPGGFISIDTNQGERGFGLGKNDTIRLFTADGSGAVDSYSWTEHAFTEGRVPDGSSSWTDTVPTRDAANDRRASASPIVINEIESNGDARGDWVELANTDIAHTVDLSGWTLVDGDPEHAPIVLPDGTTIESGGYRAIITDGTAYNADFGLGGGDSVTLRDATGAVVDRFSWESHAAVTYARCADMTGAFVDSAASTFELVNDCATAPEPVVDAQPWPFAGTAELAVAAGTWGDDMSGLDFGPDGTLYAVNNDNAEIFALHRGDDGLYASTESWIAHYTDGSGQLDAEGLTAAGDGSVFLATERDNAFKSTSRPMLVRVELGATGDTTATHQWDPVPVIGQIGTNLGPEAIEWISDADAQRLGLADLSAAGGGDAGAAAAAADLPRYDPAAYGDHFGGVFAVAVEQTGLVYLLVLEADGGITLLQTAALGDAIDLAMALDWRAGGNELWAMCDEACDNRSVQLRVVDGLLTPVAAYRAPASMNPSYTNEGLAFAWCAADPAAEPTVAWISDTAHEGVSLRVAVGSACSVVETPTPTEPGETIDPVETADPGAGDDDGTGADAAGGQGALPQTGAGAPTGLVVGALLALLLGAGLVLRRRRSLA